MDTCESGELIIITEFNLVPEQFLVIACLTSGHFSRNAGCDAGYLVMACPQKHLDNESCQAYAVSDSGDEIVSSSK